MPDPYIIGDSSPFLKRVLVPFWVVRIIVMVCAIGVYAFLLWGVSRISEYDFGGEFESEYVGRAKSTILAIFSIIMILILICLILDIVSIVKRSRRTLSPRYFLISNVIQTVVWLILFILSMIGSPTGLAVAIMVIVLLSFVGLLIYAAVVFHQFRKGKLSGGNYAPAFNPAVAGAAPQAYGVNQTYGNTEYSGPYNHELPQAVPKPAYYGEAQRQQTGYGYEPNRAV